jgi:Protein of unknown function (DUF1592)/Protein of unknown function (DUF1588)/Protein of unknown function (DUF1587)/Protein of unknown function (DUF1585)/Protein of unknown function (DUF1595)
MRTALALLLVASPFGYAASGPGSFEKDVLPILRDTCSTCHNEKLASGGINLKLLMDPATVGSNRDTWEMVLAKVRAGEMPPDGVDRPPQVKLDAFIQFVQAQFDTADKNAKIDPGRVTAHRLNRAEYSNTVRDLLGVDFRAADEFPADDSGYGFDNIGDVLTVSPTLMQKYLSVAEKIAARAVGGDPLPKPGFFNNKELVRHLSSDITELTDILDYDADYIVKVNLVGHRGNDSKPVTLLISVDGKPYKTVEVPVQISAVNKQGGATQRSSEEVKVFLTGNQHTFRAEFVNDEELAKIPEKQRTNNNNNIYPDTIELGGPFPPAEPHTVQRKILMCQPSTGAACVDRILTTVIHRAYRRPVAKADLDGPTRIFNQAKAAGYNALQSLQFAVATVLVNPQFLFRLERDPKAGTTAPITDVEMASRLSYFVWSSMPDDELLRLAETNQLHQPAVLDAQVKRMIADPKSSAFAENFVGQWLETRSLDAVKRDEKKFPEWNTELKEAMRTETRMFFEAVMRQDCPLSDFIDGKYTFLNELLAKHYGVDGVTGPDFRRVELSGEQRSGVFTQGSVLTVSAYPTRTSVVLRGKYILENVLNSPPPPPPPDVPALNESTVGVAASLRQQMESHRSEALCASCHSKMDPLGFALENYDAIGKWRTQDGKFPVDASGKFPDGKEFNGSAQMKSLLVGNMPEFTRCVAEKMLTYALGRGVESFDRLTVQNVVRDTAQHDYKLQSLILAIVRSAPFQQRRGEAKPAAPNSTQTKEIAKK